jgi:uncharacterized membrane protein
VQTVEIETDIHLPPDDIYAVLLDLPGYAKYSKYLERVERMSGDGGPGTEYALRFEWGHLDYAVRSEVTAVEPPTQIDWTITSALAAQGHWQIESVSQTPPETLVRLVVNYEPNSVGPGDVGLPPFISFDWLIEEVQGLIMEEGKRVVDRLVTDLEGESRPVDLSVRTT